MPAQMLRQAKTSTKPHDAPLIYFHSTFNNSNCFRSLETSEDKQFYSKFTAAGNPHKVIYLYMLEYNISLFALNKLFFWNPRREIFQTSFIVLNRSLTQF